MVSYFLSLIHQQYELILIKEDFYSFFKTTSPSIFLNYYDIIKFGYFFVENDRIKTLLFTITNNK